MRKSDTAAFDVLIVLAMVSWGGSWVTARWASAYPPELTSFWRFAVSAASFVPFLLGPSKRADSAQRVPATNVRTLLWLTLCVATLVLYNALFLFGLKSGTASHGGVFVPTVSPLLSFLIAGLFLKQKTNATLATGLGLGIVGGLLQFLTDRFDLSTFADPTNLAFLAAALAYAVFSHASAIVQTSMSVYVYSFWLYAISTLALVPFVAGLEPFAFDRLGFDFWANVGYLALGAGTFGTSLYLVAAQRVGAAHASSFGFLVPVSALVLAFVVLGETPHVTGVVGGAFSVVAVVLIQKSRKSAT